MIELARGHWFQTFTGRALYIDDPRPEDISITDIAHALSRTCRFGGHLIPPHYSVAQHSVLVSYVCQPEHALIGLLHDASEAYIGDVISPLKLGLANYRLLEEKWQSAIGLHFGLDPLKLVKLPMDVKIADHVLLATEKRDLMGPPPQPWGLHEQPLANKIIAQDADSAKITFLARFNSLKGISGCSSNLSGWMP